METPAPGRTTAPARDGDWASQTADTIDRFVETVRSNTSDRLVSVARLGVTALVLVAVFLIRFVDAYLPAGVWAAELVVGGLFTLGGLFLWQQAWKRPRDKER